MQTFLNSFQWLPRELERGGGRVDNGETSDYSWNSRGGTEITTYSWRHSPPLVFFFLHTPVNKLLNTNACDFLWKYTSKHSNRMIMWSIYKCLGACVFVFVCVCVQVCVCVSEFVCVCVCVVCACICVNVLIHNNTQTCTCMETWMHAYIQTYKYDKQTYKHAKKHAFRNTDIHAYIHPFIHTCIGTEAYLYAYKHTYLHLWHLQKQSRRAVYKWCEAEATQHAPSWHYSPTALLPQPPSTPLTPPVARESVGEMMVRGEGRWR